MYGISTQPHTNTHTHTHTHTPLHTPLPHLHTHTPPYHTPYPPTHTCTSNGSVSFRNSAAIESPIANSRSLVGPLRSPFTKAVLTCTKLARCRHRLANRATSWAPRVFMETAESKRSSKVVVAALLMMTSTTWGVGVRGGGKSGGMRGRRNGKNEGYDIHAYHQAQHMRIITAWYPCTTTQ